MIGALLLAAAAVAAPWAGGEVLEYKLTWLGMDVGRMTLTAADSGDAWSFALTSATEGTGARIYPIEQELESLVRKEDFQTLYYRKWERKGEKPEKEGETLFDPGAGEFFYRDFRPLPGPCVDMLSFIYLLRLDKTALRAPPKAYDRGKFYGLAFEEKGEQDLILDGKRYRARKVVPRMTEEGKKKKKGSMTLWFGPPPRRAPLRIDFSIPIGTLKAELVCEP